MASIIPERFDELQQTLTKTLEHLADRIPQAAEIIAASYKNGGGVFIFGNGGSAADAQHIAGELNGRFLFDRPPLKAQALGGDMSVLTCIANDYGYDAIFSRQLQANAAAGDVAIGLSTSGNSLNVVQALKVGKDMGLATLAITGAGGGKCAEYADLLLDIPSRQTPRIQEAGMLVYHLLCEIVEKDLFGE